MPQVFSFLAAAAGAVFLVKLIQTYLSPSKRTIPLPPGPPATWCWQNALPSIEFARTISDWVAQYGPVISVRQGSTTTIVVGRVDATAEILEQEGRFTAGRPRWVAAQEILSTNLRLLLEGDTDRFRRLRRITQTNLQPKFVQACRTILLQDAKKLIVHILNDPHNHQEHALGYAASVIIRVTYGKDAPTSSDAPEVQRIHQVIANLGEALRPGAYLVDRFPILKYLPGYGRQLNEWHCSELKLFKEQMARVEHTMATGECSPSFCRGLLEMSGEHNRDEMAYLAGSMFGAGSETTGVSIMNMILAAASHQDAQARVRDELDTIVGRDRVPSWEDAALLPQLNAFILEAARWRPVLRYGVPHRVSEDIIWKGQLIPAHATIYGCHLAISKDPVAFPNPEKFDPQRWLTDAGQLRTDIKFYPYGFGRRICPGMHLANSSQYISLAYLLWSFHIIERPDAPINVDAYSDTFVSRPAPFQVDFVLQREEKLLRAIMETDE